MQIEDTLETTFTAFVRDTQDRLRHALVAAFGIEAGREAAAEALAYGWRHWERVSAMDNPAGYLYRVGQRAARRLPGDLPLFSPTPGNATERWFEPGLPTALDRLSRRQRVAVVLAHGYGLTHREVAELLHISRSSVQRHLERGLAKLRADLGVTDA